MGKSLTDPPRGTFGNLAAFPTAAKLPDDGDTPEQLLKGNGWPTPISMTDTKIFVDGVEVVPINSPAKAKAQWESLATSDPLGLQTRNDVLNLIGAAKDTAYTFVGANDVIDLQTYDFFGLQNDDGTRRKISWNSFKYVLEQWLNAQPIIANPKTFTGPVKLTGLDLSDPTSAINVGQADARYAEAATPKAQWESLATSDPLDAPTQLAIRTLIDAGSDGLLYGSGVPDSSLGENGQAYVDIATGIIYKKTAGAWAAQPGTPKKEVTFVTGLPANGYGANGDIAVVSTAGRISGLAEKTGGAWSLIADAVTDRPTDFDTLSLVDHFCSFVVQGSTPTNFGDLNWVIDVQGAGGVRGFGETNPSPKIGVVRMFTGNSGGGDTVIGYLPGDSGGTMAITGGTFTRLTNFSMAWDFRHTVGCSLHIGLSNVPSGAASAPTRFVGLRALPADTNYNFCSIVGSSNVVDSGVAINATWQRFEIGYVAGTNSWRMRIGSYGINGKLTQGSWVTVANNLSYNSAVALAYWLNQSSAEYHSLYLDTFQLYGKFV